MRKNTKEMLSRNNGHLMINNSKRRRGVMMKEKVRVVVWMVLILFVWRLRRIWKIQLN